MKARISLCCAVTLFTSALTPAAYGQSVLDLLRSVQPANPAAQAQPDPQGAAAPAPNPPPAVLQPLPALDTKPAFLSITTNSLRITNIVVVTNYVVVTNFTFTTNYYNAQGQLLTPIAPGALPALAVASPTPSAPPPPDPAVIRSNRLQAVRELLTQSLVGASNALAVDGSFSRNQDIQIRIPEGVTVFDRKKAQTLTTALNVAAERAVPGTFAVLQKAVIQLNPPDPALLLQGGADSATRYLISTSGQDISNQALVVVQGTAADARVPEAYSAVMLRGGGLLGSVLGTDRTVDMNAQITRGLIEAVFLKVAAQEGNVRTDPSIKKSKTLQDALSNKL